MLKKIFLGLLLILNISFANDMKMFQSVPKDKATLVKTDSSKEFCNVCGMHLTKFYKTSHATEFKNGHKEQYCSLHCQAQIHENFGDKIKKIEVVDTNSLKFIDAKTAIYVVGSTKKGTMSPVSKYAFSTIDEAKEFNSKFGGEIKTFDEALEIAKDSLYDDMAKLENKKRKMALKGKKVYSTLCKESSKLEFNSVGEAKQYLIDNKICKKMKPQMLQAVSIYLTNPSLATSKEKSIKVPEGTKCPVCGMFVAKYPKWVALIKTDDHAHYFDGVKDMMKFYFNPSKFAHNHSKMDFNNIQVTNYYTLEGIDGKKAFYVIGSNVYGPMGEELIPFSTQKEAENFKKTHFGKKILRFEEIKEEDLY